MKYWEEIVNKVPVSEAISLYSNLRPNRAGFVCCPFHNEKTPSMKLSEKGYYCFGCHEHGNVISFVMKYFNLDFKSACAKIDYDFKLNLPINRKLTEEEKARNKQRWIQEQRKIKEEQQYQQFKENYIKNNVNKYAKLENEIMEYLPLFYKDPNNPYNVGKFKEIQYFDTTIHIPTDCKNFNSELLDDEDFQLQVEKYIKVVKEFNSLVLPSEEQLRVVYNSTKSRFYINN